jgi:hypothetical protein
MHTFSHCSCSLTHLCMHVTHLFIHTCTLHYTINEVSMHKLKSISKSVYKHEDWHHFYSNTTHVYNINQFILFCVSVCLFLLCALQFVVACCVTALHASSYRSLTASSKLKQCPLQLVKLVRHSRRSRSLEVTLSHACLAYTAQHPSTSTSSSNNNSSQHVHKAQHKIEPSQHKPFK